MIRPTSKLSVQRRPADTDATVMALSGLVLLLLLLLAFVSGLALWQWRQATSLRGMVAQQGPSGNFMIADDSGPDTTPPNEDEEAMRTAALVGVMAAGPFEALPALVEPLVEKEPFPDTPPVNP